jgi:hypothetical protein
MRVRILFSVSLREARENLHINPHKLPFTQAHVSNTQKHKNTLTHKGAGDNSNDTFGDGTSWDSGSEVSALFIALLTLLYSSSLCFTLLFGTLAAFSSTKL